MKNVREMTQDEMWVEGGGEAMQGNQEKAATYHSTAKLMAEISAAMRLCRKCLMRTPPSSYARYCYVTCWSPGNGIVILDEDPTGDLRRIFAATPTLGDILEELKQQDEKTKKEPDAG